MYTHCKINLTEQIQVERVFIDGVNSLVSRISINEKFARILLQANHWDVDKIARLVRNDRNDFLRKCHIDAKPEPKRKLSSTQSVLAKGYCSVCAMDGYTELPHLTCGHCFCEHCWKSHVESR